ncbi:MAG: hypothetical protein ACRDYW_02225 [Acidimicrobiales bacterium]
MPSRLRSLLTRDPLASTCGASLLGLVVINNDDPWLFVGVAAICLVVLPRRGLLTHPLLWAGLFVGVGLRQLATWHTIDDHAIAATYWCGALALGLGTTRPDRTLAASARYIVGTLFAFAAGWKLLSGQFADGTFFRYSLLFDDRFETVADVVGGTSDSARREGVASVSQLLFGTGRGVARVDEGTRNEAVALTFTWWGLVIETAVAVTFLAPLRERWGWVRHATLVAFAGTTYLVVPIGGFGTLLLVLGAAMVTTDRARLAYYTGAAALLVWSGLWPLVFT